MSILTGLGALLGGVSGLASANTGTQGGTGTQSTSGMNNQTNYGSTAGSTTGSTASTFNPAQKELQGTTSAALQKYITTGPNLTPAMTTGTDAINQTYKGIGDSLQQSLASRGFGNSGASGTAALQTGLARGGAVGSLQAQLEAAAQAQQLQALQTATGFGFAAPGSTGSTSSSGNTNGGTTAINNGTTTGSSTGTYTNPSSPYAGAVSGGLGAMLGGANLNAAQGGAGLPSWMTQTPWGNGSAANTSGQGLVP